MIGIAIANSIGSRRSSGSVVVVPVATAATGVGQTSFTANWNAFAGANYYLLDVSLNSSFSSFVGSYQNYVVIGTSQLVSGLTPNTTYYYRLRAATGIDSDAASFFTRVYTAGGTLSYTEVTATETLVSNLKSAGIWSAMRAVYPMVGASAAACAQNLKSSSFTGSFSSGWTFSANGVQGNGTSAYMDTNFNPVTQSQAQNSTYLSVYVRNNTGSGYDMGNSQDVGIAVKPTYIISRYPTNNAYVGIADSSYGTALSNFNSIGFWSGGTNGSSAQILYKNGTSFVTGNSAQTGFFSSNFYLGAVNGAGVVQFPSNHEYAFSTIGNGLSPTQSANFYTAVQAFQTTLSRQV